MKKDYYEILGLTEEDKKLPSDKFQKKLKKIYRDLCIKYHPDRNTDKTDEEKKVIEEKFKDISEAYSVLSDEQKRSDYDNGDKFGGFRFTSEMNPEDIFNQFFSREGFNFGFRGNGNSRRNYEPEYENGTDKKIRVNVSIDDIFFHRKKEIKYNIEGVCEECKGTGSEDGKVCTCDVCGGTGYMRYTTRTPFGFTQVTKPCAKCNGTGKVISNPCPHCHGRGSETEQVTKEIQVPYIDKIDMTYRSKGGGNKCLNSMGKDGDLYFSFKINQTDKFYFNENDLRNIWTNVEVPVLKCITGGDVEIPMIDGIKTTVTIPKFTNDGAVFYVKGYGMPTSYGEKGDLIVKVKMKMPSNISNSETKTLNKLMSSNNFK